MRQPLSALFLLLAVVTLPTAGLLAQQRMTPELLWQLKRVSDVRPSPDGGTLVYHVRGYELEKNSGTTQIWKLDIATGAHTQLTQSGSNWNTRWSADGGEIAFLSTRGGDGAQIYRMKLSGGEARRVFTREGGVANMDWSPTGAHFSFTADVKLDADIHDRHPDLPKANAAVFDDLMVRHWDQWKDGTYSHLFVVDADGAGEARDLMGKERVDTPLKPFGGGEQITWAKDGKSLVYVAKRVPNPEASTNSELWRVAIDGGAHECLTEGMPGYEINPAFSPDGTKLAFESMARGGYESDRNRLMVRDLATGTTTDVTEGWDLSCAEFCWSVDGKSLFLVADTQGAHHVFVAMPTPSQPRQITQGRWHYSGIASTKNAVYALRQQTERPYEVVQINAATGSGLARSESGSDRVLTDVNGRLYAKLDLPKVEERRFKATDGKDVHCWITYPPNFDASKKYPMLTYCQGGPQSQVGQWFSYRWNFHLMAAQGYIVLGINRRGLPGFGTEWNEQISGDWGGQAMQDILSATDGMFEEPYVDREHTAAIGASFGGYTVYWLMGNDQPDRFCTMIAHCGVFNLESMYLSTEEHFFVNWDLGGPFWRDASLQKKYTAFSPHEYIKNWDTPLMVIHGARDYRVPLEQGLQAFQAAQIEGVPSRFLYFPEEGHWVLSPQSGVVWHREFFRWLDRFCKPGSPAARAAQKGAIVALDDVTTGAAEDERAHLIEQIDDTAIAQLYADGFETLDLQDKVLCYHLANAAIAGRDIFIDQRFEHALAIRDLLEALYRVRTHLGPETGSEIERYTKLFWVHNGIHHNISAQKMPLRLSRAAFERALEDAAAAGATLPTKEEALRLYGIITDPALYQSVTSKTPGDGLDPVAVSANNLYAPGLTMADLDRFDEQHPLNSRVVRTADGSLVEEVYRAGDPAQGIPPGRYAAHIERMIHHLDLAADIAPAPTAKALRHLIRFYRTGAVEDWRAFNIAWVQDTDSVVDQINGFVEVYMDVRGQKGAWEAVVSFLNKPKTTAIKDLARRAQWFEDRMPWDDEFKKKKVRGITARAISVITETGDSGPVTPIGINLPNESDIRENYGSKSVNLVNVVEGYDKIRAGGSLAEFAWSEDEIVRAHHWRSLSGDIHTNLHEVVGHASGRLRPEIKNPASKLGLYYSTLEEARADLVGLYWIADSRLIEMGLVPHEDAALAEYEAYARNALVQLRRVPRGKRLADDHMRNRQLIVLWLIENGEGAIEVRERNGHTYYVIADKDAFRRGCGVLLAEIMRIKATGDFKAGKALVDRYGTEVDPQLHEEVLTRIEALGLPSVTGFIQPELTAVRNTDGSIVDVQVNYPKDLERQMLGWSARSK